MHCGLITSIETLECTSRCNMLLSLKSPPLSLLHRSNLPTFLTQATAIIAVQLFLLFSPYLHTYHLLKPSNKIQIPYHGQLSSYMCCSLLSPNFIQTLPSITLPQTPWVFLSCLEHDKLLALAILCMYIQNLEFTWPILSLHSSFCSNITSSKRPSQVPV